MGISQEARESCTSLFSGALNGSACPSIGASIFCMAPSRICVSLKRLERSEICSSFLLTCSRRNFVVALKKPDIARRVWLRRALFLLIPTLGRGALWRVMACCVWLGIVSFFRQDMVRHGVLRLGVSRSRFVHRAQIADDLRNGLRCDVPFISGPAWSLCGIKSSALAETNNVAMGSRNTSG